MNCMWLKPNECPEKISGHLVLSTRNQDIESCIQKVGKQYKALNTQSVECYSSCQKCSSLSGDFHLCLPV